MENAASYVLFMIFSDLMFCYFQKSQCVRRVEMHFVKHSTICPYPECRHAVLNQFLFGGDQYSSICLGQNITGSNNYIYYDITS